MQSSGLIMSIETGFVFVGRYTTEMKDPLWGSVEEIMYLEVNLEWGCVEVHV